MEGAAREFFVIRLTTRQRDQIRQAAAVNGMTQTEFCREAIDAAIGDCMEAGAGSFRR